MRDRIIACWILIAIFLLSACGGKEASTPSNTSTEDITEEKTSEIIEIAIGETIKTRDYEITLNWAGLGSANWVAFHSPLSELVTHNVSGNEKNDYIQVEFILKNISKGSNGAKTIGSSKYSTDITVEYDYDNGYRYALYDGEYTGRSYYADVEKRDNTASSFSKLTLQPLKTLALSFYSYVSVNEIITNTEAPLKIIINLDDGTVLEHSVR